MLAIGPSRVDVRQAADQQIPQGWSYAAAAARRRGESDPYHLVKFATAVGTRQRALLSAAGFRVVAYYPYNTFLVRPLAGHSADELALIEGVSWTGRFQPQFKLDHEIAEALAADGSMQPAVDSEWGLRFVVGVHEQEGRSSVAARLESIAGVSLLPTRGPLRIRVEPSALAEALKSIAALPQVAFIEAWHEAETGNDQNVQTSQSGQCNAAGPEAPNTSIFAHGITGWNARVAVADTCLDANEGWFYDATLGTLPAHEMTAPWNTVPPDWGQRKLVEYYDMYSADTTMGCNGATGCGGPCADHGTHVSSTAVGNCNLDIEGIATQTVPGNRDGDNDGMAPGARLIAQDLGNGTLFYLSADGGDLGELIDVAYDNTCDGPDCGIDIHNNSWNTTTDAYETNARAADASLWNHKDVVTVVSAGNAGVAGYNTIRAPSTGKNVIGVGSALACATQSMVNTSGRGDASDGRLKPDIVASGDGVTSAQNDGDGSTNANGGCQVQTINGTSMAAGTVSGLLALIRQYYEEGFYPGGLANAPDALSPSGMLAKATLIASGRRMTGTGAEPSGVTWPNMDQGYGYAVLDDALYFDGDSSGLWVHDEPVGLDVSGTSSMSFQRGVTDGAIPLKVTLVWYDTEHIGACGVGTPCLVNDLDLTVHNDTTGASYSVTLRPGSPGHVVPRTVVPSSPSAGQTTIDSGPDNLNTVEQIVIYTPTSPGNYTFTVTAANTPDGPIPFALVATGALAEPCPEPVAPLNNSTADDLAACLDTGVEVTWDLDSPDWADDGTGQRYYQVLRDGVAITGGGCGGLQLHGTTSCVDDSAPNDTDIDYTVRYRNSCGGTVATAGETAADLTGLTVDVTPDGSTEVCPTSPVMLTADVTPPRGGYTYQWTANGADIPGEIGPTLLVSQPEVITLQYNCRVTDTEMGCMGQDTSSSFVHWTEGFSDVEYDATFDPLATLTQTCGDGDGVVEPGEVWQVTTQLENVAECGVAQNSRADLALAAGSPVSAQICTSTGYYGAIPAGSTATATYSFKVDPASDCGIDAEFDMTDIWWHGGGVGSAPQAFGLQVGTAFPGNDETAVQFADPISAAGGLSSSVMLPSLTLAAGTVTKAELDYGLACSQGPLLDLYVDSFDSLSGWTVSGAVSSNGSVADTCGSSGGNNAYFNGDGTITRTITTSGRESIRVLANFRGGAAYTDPGECFRWYYSTDGGANYILYKEFCGAAIPDGTWQCSETFDFPPEADNKSGFRLRFQTVGGVDIRLDRLRVRGRVPACDITDDVKIEVPGPGGGTLLVKDVGNPDPPKPIDITSFYNGSGGGPGLWRVRVTESSGGTASLAGATLDITDRPPGECDVSPSCDCPGGPPGEVSDDPSHLLGLVRTNAKLDLLFEDLGATNYNVYVSTQAESLPFAISAGLGKADCAVTTASAPGGMRIVENYDIDGGVAMPSDIHFLLVTADNGSPNEGIAGYTSTGVARTTETLCAP